MHTTTAHNPTENFEIWLPFFLQSRLKQVPNSNNVSILDTNTNTHIPAHILCDCTTCYQTHSYKALFTITTYAESYLSAAMQNLNLSPSDAGVDPTINSRTNFNPSFNLQINGNDPDVVFPPHIFPQLESLKRDIKHSEISDEDMEPLHWPTGRRPNRPFETINSDWLSILHSLSPRSFPAPPTPAPAPPTRRSAPPVKQCPTAYYLEQAAFYSQIPGPDPFYTPPSPMRPGPLKIFVHALLSLFFWVLTPLLPAVKQFGSGVLAVLRWLSWVLVLPVKFAVGAVKTVEWRWDVVLAVALAAQLVRLLPGVGVGVRGGGEDGEGPSGPVYTVYVAGRNAIGNGAVPRSASI